MTYEQLKHLKPNAFKRRCGVQPDTFGQMVEILRPDLGYGDDPGKMLLSPLETLLQQLF